MHLDCIQADVDLGTREGLSNVVRIAEVLIDLSTAQQQRLEADRRKMVEAKPLAEMSYPELVHYYSQPDEYLSPRDRRGLEVMKQCAQRALEAWGAAGQDHLISRICEIAAAINNNHRLITPEKLDLLNAAEVLRRYVHNPVAQGNRPAAHLDREKHDDFSQADPTGSTFWQRPRSIDSQDLYAGYGRAFLPNFADRIWRYEGPKKGSGSSPGFFAEWEKEEFKVKFQEVTSGPFTARIFSCLGYHVERVDHAAFLRVRYDRRLLREFNLRKERPVPVEFFGLPLSHVHYQRRYDPFQFITAAVMKDGSRLSGTELRHRLFRRPSLEHPEDHPANFRPEVERQIDYLVTAPACLQPKNDHGYMKEIGPWDFDRLGHEDLRELRGAGLVAAWLNWCDCLFQNTRLKVNKQGICEHWFTDLGRGLGKGTGINNRLSESPNDLPWSFTRPPKWQGVGRMFVPFRIVGYKPLEETAAFKEMTIEDARWMARLIGQLSEAQITEALVASGFNAAEVRLYTEKLISRRDQMVRDLRLTDDIALLRPKGPNRDLQYDPAKDGPVILLTRAGQLVQAQRGNSLVLHGQIVPGPTDSVAKAPTPDPSSLALRLRETD